MGGSINLTSEPGFGSTFRLSFHSASLPGAPTAMEKVPSLEA
jgi:signal transduction histidine kinase